MHRNPNKIDYSRGLPSHFHSFEIIEDPHKGGNKRYHFGGILFMATPAMLCGMNGFADIEHLESGITLAQVFVSEKSNGIEAIPRLLENLELKGHTVSIDAMGTHTHIADKIIAKGCDYILALKGNQGNLHKELQDHFDFALRQFDLSTAHGWSTDSDMEKAHERITTRTVLTTTNLEMLDAEMKAK